MQLRLLLTEECNRRCKGCCNKDYDLSALPVCRSYSGYKSIMITGGEPLLKPTLLDVTIRCIRADTRAPIYVYTAWREDPVQLLNLLRMVDGITLTLHTRKDAASFAMFDRKLKTFGNQFWANKSLRLNVFRGIKLDHIDLSLWKVKKDIVWIKDCPVPENEVFMRLKPA